MTQSTAATNRLGRHRFLSILSLLLFTHPALRATEPGALTRPAAQAAIQKASQWCPEALRWSSDCPKRAVAVTGITDGPSPGTKRVEFTWYFTTLSENVAKRTGFTTGDHRGTAFFRLYDDGWRLITGDRDKSLAGKGGSNTRPFVVESPSQAFDEIREDVCPMATAFGAHYIDFNSFYLVDSMHSKDVNHPMLLDDRRDGARSKDLVKTALSPLYIRQIPDLDPYGNEYLFEIRANGNEVHITSLGPDHKLGGGDDTVYVVRAGTEDSFLSTPKGATFQKCR